MRLHVVLREAVQNTSFLLFCFLVSFPILGPALLWLVRHFFGLFDSLDTVFRAMKG